MKPKFLEAIDLLELHKEYRKYYPQITIETEFASKDFELHLKIAVEKGFLIKTESGAFKFSHDRVRQAVRSMR